MRYQRDGFSVRSAIKKRRPLPPDHWYLQEPRHIAGCDLYYHAFQDLMTCRAPDGPIPWTAAMAYADRKRLTPDLADAMWTIVSRMDNVERAWQLEQLKAETGSGG